MGVLQQLTQHSVDNPSATSAELQQKAQLLWQQNQLLSGGLFAGGQQNSAFQAAQLLAGLFPTNQLQPQWPQPAARPPAAASGARPAAGDPCYQCGFPGHFAKQCTNSFTKGGQPVNRNRLSFAPKNWRDTYHFDDNGFKKL